MQFFNFDDAKTPTKLFVSHIKESSTKVVAKSGVTAALDVLVKIAPELIDKGAEFISKAIAEFAEDHTTKTFVQKNIDASSKGKIFLPKRLTLVRGIFAPNIHDSHDGEIFGDGVQQELNQVKLISDKELQIEIAIIPSANSDAVYFQPVSYFYKGEDIDGHNIDEIIIGIAFVPAGEAISAYKKLTYQSILHFRELDNNQKYLFESENGYDTSYQSPWIIPYLSQSGPYTLVVGIQEIRKGNSFAKLVQDIYEKHDDELVNAIKEEVDKRLKSATTTDNATESEPSNL